MGTKRLKVQIAVSMQLQMALHDPTQGIRVLCNKMISHFLNKNIYTPLQKYWNSKANSFIFAVD